MIKSVQCLALNVSYMPFDYIGIEQYDDVEEFDVQNLILFSSSENFYSTWILICLWHPLNLENENFILSQQIAKPQKSNVVF